MQIPHKSSEWGVTSAQVSDRPLRTYWLGKWVGRISRLLPQEKQELCIVETDRYVQFDFLANQTRETDPPSLDVVHMIESKRSRALPLLSKSLFVVSHLLAKSKIYMVLHQQIYAARPPRSLCKGLADTRSC